MAFPWLDRQRRHLYQVVGGNFRLDALQAAVLRVKLRHLDDWTAARQRNAAHYRQMFGAAGLTGVELPWESGNGRHIYNQFVIRLAPRDSLMAHLKARQIGHEVYYPLSMHQQACFASLGHRTGDFLESEAAALETVAIPIYPELTEAQQQIVVDAVVAYLN